MGPPASASGCPDGATVRWLAQMVLGESAHRMVQQVPVPRLVSAHLERSDPAVRDYVTWWIRHPESGGSFDAKTRWLRWLPDGWLLRLLTTLAYDGIVYPSEGCVLGHVFYQRHGNAWHGFSTAVSDELAGRGCSVVMMLDYLAWASRVPGIVRARIGRGENNVTRRLLERLAKHEEQLGWRVSEDGWVDFSRR